MAGVFVWALVHPSNIFWLHYIQVILLPLSIICYVRLVKAERP